MSRTGGFRQLFSISFYYKRTNIEKVNFKYYDVLRNNAYHGERS